MIGFWDAVASVGLYANNMHFASDAPAKAQNYTDTHTHTHGPFPGLPG